LWPDPAFFPPWEWRSLALTVNTIELGQHCTEGLLFLHSERESIYDRSCGNLLIACNLPLQPTLAHQLLTPCGVGSVWQCFTHQTKPEVALTIQLGRATPMGLPTRPLRPRKTTDGTRDTSVLFTSLALGLLVLCLPLVTGCADGNSGDDLAKIGNGHARGSAPTISLTPTDLVFTATEGGSNPAGQAVDVSNSKRGTLDWSASTTATWLALSPDSGTNSASFNATAMVAGLAAGTYSTTITITATGATNTPQSIPVTLTVSSAMTAAVVLAWDSLPDPNVMGYYVHYGPQSPNSAGSCAYAQRTYYPLSSLTNTTSPRATVSSLALGTTYFFAVSANNGIEGPCSNEVTKAT
jgi:fibronectin type III domain protein